MNKLKKYDVSADIIRILAAFFVVFSHTTDVFVLWPVFINSPSWHIVYFMNTLSRVAVPVFVILSGYLILDKAKTNDIQSFYKKRFSRVLFPFIVWLIIYYARAFYLDHIPVNLQFIFKTLWQGDIWHLYFLIIILELYILAPFLVRFMENKSRQKQSILFWSLIAFSFICAIVANVPGFHFDVARYSLTIFLPYIAYFYAGAYFRSTRISKVQAIVCGMAYFFLAFLTNFIAKGNMSTFIVFNYSPTLLPMSIFLFLSLKNADQFFKKAMFSKKLLMGISFVATTTFGIYLVHFMILDWVRGFFHLSPWQIHTPLVFYGVLPAFLTFLISFIIVALGRKIPYVKYIFG